MRRLGVWLILLAAPLALRAADEAAPPAAPAAPEKVIQDFYGWYVGELVGDHDPFEDGRETLQRYVTPRLLREIDDLRGSPDGLDADYFLDAQDFDKGWGKNIHVATPIVQDGGATAEVELVGTEMGTRKLLVVLAQEDGGWKIDRVAAKEAPPE